MLLDLPYKWKKGFFLKSLGNSPLQYSKALEKLWLALARLEKLGLGKIRLSQPLNGTTAQSSLKI